MERYDRLYRLYEETDTETLRAYQEFVDLFPPLDSPITLEQWREIKTELEQRKADVAERFPATGQSYAELAARLTHDEAFTALDLYTKHDRAVNVLVLDVDETLRSAGYTDNEIPRDTLHLLTQFHEDGVPIVVCTGQTLENVKGFTIQGLGNDVVSSGSVSIVYESGNGVFTPGHGPETKRLLYEDLDPTVVDVFDAVRRRVLSEAPDDLVRRVHLQGNEFNVTLKPNAEIGSETAVEVIDEGVRYLCALVGQVLAEQVDPDVDRPAAAARTYFGQDPEIRAVFEAADEACGVELDAVPDRFLALLERIDVGYYEGDATELVSLELDKAAGVEAALDILDIEEPFALVLGDSKSDLRVMEWVADTGTGIAAAPDHASADVLDHVQAHDDLVFEAGDATSVLQVAYGSRLLAELDDHDSGPSGPKG